MVFPVTVSAVGVFVCLLCSFIASVSSWGPWAGSSSGSSPSTTRCTRTCKCASSPTAARRAIIPVLVLAVVVYGSFAMDDMYGVSLAVIRFLSNLATGLTIDDYVPLCDNVGGECKIARAYTILSR